MTIRKATHNETEKILEFSLEVMKESVMNFVIPTQEKSLQLVSPFLLNGGYYLIYTKNNIVNGWIGIGKSVDLYSDQIIGIIPELYVKPQFRKQGIAKALCGEAIIQMKKDGLRKVQLNVFSGNQVKQLYESLGFQDVSILMQKNLVKDM